MILHYRYSRHCDFYMGLSHFWQLIHIHVLYGSYVHRCKISLTSNKINVIVLFYIMLQVFRPQQAVLQELRWFLLRGACRGKTTRWMAFRRKVWSARSIKLKNYRISLWWNRRCICLPWIHHAMAGYADLTNACRSLLQHTRQQELRSVLVYAHFSPRSSLWSSPQSSPRSSPRSMVQLLHQPRPDSFQHAGPRRVGSGLETNKALGYA